MPQIKKIKKIEKFLTTQLTVSKATAANHE